MPILARIFRPPTSRRAVVLDDPRSVEFRSVDGSQTIVWDGVNVRILAGALGLEMPPREVIRDRSPGLPGARLRKISDLEREVFLPILASSEPEDWRGLLERMAQFRSMVDFREGDYVANEGTLDLVAITDGHERLLRCEYLSGLEGDYAEDAALPNWRRFGLSLVAVNPFWRGDAWSTPTIALPSPNPFLSNDGPAHPLRLSTAVALGLDMPVTVPGDVGSPAIAELVGPATMTHITSTSGLDVTIGSLSAGQTFVLDTGRKRSALLNGVSRWDKVGTSPKFRPLPPGQASITITMTGASSASRARVYGTSLWESAW